MVNETEKAINDYCNQPYVVPNWKDMMTNSDVDNWLLSLQSILENELKKDKDDMCIYTQSQCVAFLNCRMVQKENGKWSTIYRPLEQHKQRKPEDWEIEHLDYSEAFHETAIRLIQRAVFHHTGFAIFPKAIENYINVNFGGFSNTTPESWIEIYRGMVFVIETHTDYKTPRDNWISDLIYENPLWKIYYSGTDLQNEYDLIDKVV